MEKISLGRKFLLFAASFGMAGIVLFFYGHVPLIPILAGGLLAAAITLFSHFVLKK